MKMDTLIHSSLLQRKIFEGPENIEKIREDWDDLYRRADRMSPIFSRVWIQAFIYSDENKGTPTLVTVWDNSKLVALLPLTIRKYFGVKVAIGALSNELCCTGILVDPRYKQAIKIIAETCINEMKIHLFYNKFTSLRDECTHEFFENLIFNGFKCGRWRRYLSMKLNIDGDFEHVLRKNRSRKQREKLLYHERRVFKSGDIKVQRFQGCQISTDVVDRIGDIQENSWIENEGKAVLVEPFYKKLLLELGKSEIGQAWILNNGIDDIAFIFGLKANSKLYLKWMSYREKYGSSTLSYGKTMYMQAIRDACNESVTEIDFGIGDHKWKNLWATDTDEIEIIIAGRGFAGLMTLMLFNALKMGVKMKRFISNYFKRTIKGANEKDKTS